MANKTAAQELQTQLPILRSDFASVTGREFKNFFCPILWEDQDVELCMAHVVNKAFPGTTRTRIVQRKDVDGFFGSVVESDLQVVISARGKSSSEVFFDPHLRRKLHSKILVDGEECGHYEFRGHISPAHTLIQLQKGESTMTWVLEKPATEVISSANKCWSFVHEGDYRISAIASLIKAAHLTLFRILGYTYGTSPAGYFVGREILGKFYDENKTKSVKQAKEQSQSYFMQFANMVRPIVSIGESGIRGTIEDGNVLCCYKGIKLPFAIGVIIRISEEFHCVLIPCFDRIEDIPLYLKFLESPDETIAVKLCRFDQTEKVWITNTELPQQIIWPKNSD